MNLSKGYSFIRQFLSFLLKLLKMYFISVGFLVTALFLLLFILFLNSFMDIYQNFKTTISHSELAAPITTVSLKDDDRVMLEVKLDGILSGRSPDEREQLINRLFMEKGHIQVSQLATALRRASIDDRIAGVFVEINRIDGRLAAFDELRNAFDLFKQSGKPLHFYLYEGSTNDFFLASVGNHITMADMGSLLIPGTLFQLIYFKSALENIGIEFELVRAGKYKSAMEPFIADKPTKPTWEMYHAIHDSKLGYISDKVADSRQIEAKKVMRWFEKSYFSADGALKEKIIDRIGYLSETKDHLKKNLKVDNFISHNQYLYTSTHLDEPLIASQNHKIALIEAIGSIHMYSSGQNRQEIIPAKLIKKLRWALRDDSIKAVVLRISSPGGSALASDIIWNEVKKLREKKPVVVSIIDMAASGGYYIASAASKIVANPTSLTGSIGVFAAFVNAMNFSQKYGVNFYVVTRSARKNLFNIGERISKEDKVLMGDNIDHTYQIFLERVATGRNQAVENIEAVAEGRVFTGLQAKEFGLVDALGSLTDSYKMAKELAGLDVKKLYPIVRYQDDDFSLLKHLPFSLDIISYFIKNTIMDKANILNGLKGDINNEMLSRTSALKALLHEEKTLTYWPGYLEVTTNSLYFR